MQFFLPDDISDALANPSSRHEHMLTVKFVDLESANQALKYLNNQGSSAYFFLSQRKAQNSGFKTHSSGATTARTLTERSEDYTSD